MKKRKPNSLTAKEKENLLWDIVAEVKTSELMLKYNISATTAKYYRNPLVHKARLLRFRKKHREEERLRSKEGYWKEPEARRARARKYYRKNNKK